MKETEQTQEPFIQALQEAQKIENLAVDNSAHSFTESAYKEVEGNCSKCGHPLNPATAGYQCTNINCPAVESSEPQEKMSYWQYQQFAEAAITQLKEKNEILESDNKLLREENTKCKELSWEAANEISRLKKEIERLKAEVLKEKFPEN